MPTLLGFDHGTHKIGVAVGQTVTNHANPLCTLTRVKKQPDWLRIGRLIDEWQPDALVVGHPFEMTNRESSHAQAAKKFSRQLHGRFGLPVHLVDERLTTREAWSQIGHQAARDVTQIDAYAAKLILETWLSDYPIPDC